jgi:tetratricopeptide (TPR) repeat protein
VDHLAKHSPHNGAWQRDLWVAQNKIGQIYLDQDNATKALLEHQAARNIVERLTASDPSNAGWLRDLSISQNLIGHALLAQANLAGALKSYRDSLSIRERLAKLDPNNSQWQYDLAASQENVGDILLAEEQYAASQSYYQRRHAISRGLAASEPLNARWQFDMVESLLRLAIANVLVAQGADRNTAELARRFIIAVALPAESNMQKRIELASAICKLAKRTERARTYLQEAREILQRELAAQHLTERQKQWVTIVESALTALPK